MPVLAQGGGGGMGRWGSGDPEERREKNVTRLTDSLNLSQDQSQKLDKILADGHKEASDWMRENEGASRDDRQAFMKTHRTTTNDRIEAILSDDQMETYRGMRDRFRDRTSDNRSKRDALIEDLDLTDAQRRQFETLRKSHRAAMKAWNEQNPDASDDDRRAFREQLHKSGRASLEGTLTPEQLQKLDAHHENARHGRGHGK